MTYKWTCIAILAVSCGGHPATPDDAPDAASSSLPVDAASSSPPDATPLPPPSTRLRFVNRCAEPVWVAHSANAPGPQNARLETDDFVDIDVPDVGAPSARYWPKIGCDKNGHDCTIGDNGEGGGAPCGSSGCQPPLDSKFEATFAAVGSVEASFYNLSLVDGFTLPFAVEPVGEGAGGGSCVSSDCSTLTLDACPEELTVPGGCMSPCKHWNYPPPWGLGNPESEDPGFHYCCPSPMSAEACQDESDPLSVVHTDYVSLVHARCPTAYSYAYDDAAGLHACPSRTGFVVTFCPN